MKYGISGLLLGLILCCQWVWSADGAQAQKVLAEIRQLIKEHKLQAYDPMKEVPAQAAPTAKVIQLAITGMKDLITSTKLNKRDDIDALLGIWSSVVELDLGNDLAAVNDDLLRPHLVKINHRIEEMEKMSVSPIDKKLLLLIAVAIAGELSGSGEGNGN